MQSAVTLVACTAKVVKMINYNRPTCFITFFIITIGCVTAVRNTRLYCIETGAVITGQIKDARQSHGQISMVDPISGSVLI